MLLSSDNNIKYSNSFNSGKDLYTTDNSIDTYIQYVRQYTQQHKISEEKSNQLLNILELAKEFDKNVIEHAIKIVLDECELIELGKVGPQHI
jgi:hypothetical protein